MKWKTFLRGCINGPFIVELGYELPRIPVEGDFIKYLHTKYHVEWVEIDLDNYEIEINVKTI